MAAERNSRLSPSKALPIALVAIVSALTGVATVVSKIRLDARLEQQVSELSEREITQFVNLLDDRAMSIQKEFKAAQDYRHLNAFKTLHKKNVDALESRQFVLSREITREIFSLLTRGSHQAPHHLELPYRRIATGYPDIYSRR
jgi:hypothetical protein